jgi:hypothetical protein
VESTIIDRLAGMFEKWTLMNIVGMNVLLNLPMK